MNNQLREKKDEYDKKIELNKELQISFRTLKPELKTARNNLNQVSTRNETEKELLHKYHILQDKIAMMYLETDKIKCQNQENEKKYLQVIEILRKKNDDLQRTIKLNDETFTKTTFKYKTKISILKTEISKQKLKLENKKQSTKRQETKVKPYPFRCAVAPQPCDESQMSQNELELFSQGPRDECLGLKNKENFCISKLNISSEILSPKVSKPGKKISSQEAELCFHMIHDIRKMTMVLKQVHRDLKKTQCQVNKIEDMYQNEQSQNYKYIDEQECIDEKFSQMENEITFLRQQLCHLHNKVDDKEDIIVCIQEQCNNIKIIQDQAEKSNLKLKKIIKLRKENHHLKEKLYHYKKEKSKREVVAIQLQQELANNLKEQPMSEASLEHSSCHLNLDEEQDLEKKLNQITCKADNIIANLEDTSSKYLQLDTKFEFSLKSLQNICEKSENNQKKLEEDVANLKRNMQNNIIEHGQGVQHKWETEITRQQLQQNQNQTSLVLETCAAVSEILGQLRENNDASVINWMQLRINKLESEVSKIKTENSNEMQMEENNQLHVEEYKIQNSHRINKNLQEVNSRFPVAKQSKSLPCPHCGRPVPGCPCVKLKNDWLHNRSFSQGENMAGPSSNPQPSCQSLEDYLAEMSYKLGRGFI
uniref:ankyrin repeat domain-containing protein 26-like n=1 Tax=Ictidomys tridecemlineatus TaxID=43179 RepID=UPI001A9EA051|nr:ankyrin repeat domain-containing protein 26-like [Ictidomys tridecemlineatus]